MEYDVHNFGTYSTNLDSVHDKVIWHINTVYIEKASQPSTPITSAHPASVRFFPMASISSMKMMQGASSLASLNSFRTLWAPEPENQDKLKIGLKC